MEPRGRPAVLLARVLNSAGGGFWIYVAFCEVVDVWVGDGAETFTRRFFEGGEAWVEGLVGGRSVLDGE